MGGGVLGEDAAAEEVKRRERRRGGVDIAGKKTAFGAAARADSLFVASNLRGGARAADLATLWLCGGEGGEKGGATGEVVVGRGPQAPSRHSQSQCPLCV